MPFVDCIYGLLSLPKIPFSQSLRKQIHVGIYTLYCFQDAVYLSAPAQFLADALLVGIVLLCRVSLYSRRTNLEFVWAFKSVVQSGFLDIVCHVCIIYPYCVFQFFVISIRKERPVQACLRDR